ncbi:STAS domain-containing protein [Streptomyces sp. NPDC055287]
MDDYSASVEHITDEVTLVSLAGSLANDNAPTLRILLVDLVRQGRFSLILDLNAVGHLDSGALAVIVAALKRCRAHHGSLALVAAGGRPRKLLRTLGVDHLITVSESVPRALELLGRVPPPPPVAP